MNIHYLLNIKKKEIDVNNSGSLFGKENCIFVQEI